MTGYGAGKPDKLLEMKGSLRSLVEDIKEEWTENERARWLKAATSLLDYWCPVKAPEPPQVEVKALAEDAGESAGDEG